MRSLPQIVCPLISVSLRWQLNLPFTKNMQNQASLKKWINSLSKINDWQEEKFVCKNQSMPGELLVMAWVAISNFKNPGIKRDRPSRWNILIEVYKWRFQERSFQRKFSNINPSIRIDQKRALEAKLKNLDDQLTKTKAEECPTCFEAIYVDRKVGFKLYSYGF